MAISRDDTNSIDNVFEYWSGTQATGTTSPRVPCRGARLVIVVSNKDTMQLRINMGGTTQAFAPMDSGGGGLMKAPDDTDAGYISASVMPDALYIYNGNAGTAQLGVKVIF